MRSLFFVSVFTVGAFSCGPSSSSKIVDCTGVCGAGLRCDSLSGHCVSDGSGGGGGSSSATGMPCDVAGVLAARCISCHAATPTGGAPNSLVTRDDLIKQSAFGGTIASRCVVRVKDPTNAMPPAYSGEVLAPSDVATLENWVNAGLAGGACLSAGSTGTGGGAGGGGSASGGGGGSMIGGGAGGSATGGGTGGGSTGGGGGSASGGGAGGGTAMGGGGGTSSAYCRACTSDASCGGTSNFCIGFSFGDFCGTDCSNTTCGANQRCANIVDSTTQAVLGRNCVPVTGQTCAGGTGGGSGGGAGGGTGGGAGGGSGGGGGTCTTDTWASYGASFFANNCSNCHHHTGEFTTKSSVLASKSGITLRINAGNMPQGYALSSAEKSRIITYLNCGAP